MGAAPFAVLFSVRIPSPAPNLPDLDEWRKPAVGGVSRPEAPEERAVIAAARRAPRLQRVTVRPKSRNQVVVSLGCSGNDRVRLDNSPGVVVALDDDFSGPSKRLGIAERLSRQGPNASPLDGASSAISPAWIASRFVAKFSVDETPASWAATRRQRKRRKWTWSRISAATSRLILLKGPNTPGRCAPYRG